MKMYRILKKSLIVLFIISGIIGCKKANNVKINSSNLDNKIGYYHNLILSKYFTTSNKEDLKSATHFNYHNVEEDVVNIMVSIDNKRFDRNELESSLKSSNKILDSLGIIQMFNLKSSAVSGENDYFTKLVNYLYINHKISLDLMDSLEKINTLTIQEPMETQKILLEVKGLENKKWDEKDSKFLNAFTQVYESSYSFWTQKEVGLKSTESSEAAATVLADAAGALYGLWASPVLSIIEGAAFSLVAIANYEQ